jgi:hypothetical protein
MESWRPDPDSETKTTARYWWLTPVILATPEAEIRGLPFETSPGQIVLKTLPNTHTKKRGWRRGSSGRVPALGSNHSTIKKKNLQ